MRNLSNLRVKYLQDVVYKHLNIASIPITIQKMTPIHYVSHARCSPNHLSTNSHTKVFKITYSEGSFTKTAILKVTPHNKRTAKENSHLYVDETYTLPNQPRVLGKGVLAGDKPKSLNSLLSYELIEYIPGASYADTLTHLLESKQLEDSDIHKALAISNYLSNLYVSSAKADKLMYADGLSDFISRNLIKFDKFKANAVFYNKYCKDIKTVRKSLESLLKQATDKSTVCLVHNDLHPNNVLLTTNNIVCPIDRQGNIYGEQALDIATISLFYVWYELRVEITNKPFLHLYKLFMENYLDKTNNLKIFEVLPIFYAVKSLRLAYFNESINQDIWTNAPLLNIFCSSANEEKTSINKIMDRLQ